MMTAPGKMLLSTKNWYVIRCKPRMEFTAAHLLRTIVGLEVFLPEKKLQTSSKGSQAVSLFSGYLFIQADLNTVPIHVIKRNPGVICLVTFDDQPEPISATVIDAIYEVEARMNEMAPSPHQLEFEGTTSIQQDTLQDSAGVFAESQMQALLEILEGDNEIPVGTHSLKKLSESSRSRSHRGTRGKGRKIQKKVS